MGLLCKDYSPSSKLSQYAVQKVLWSNELPPLQGQTKIQGLGATATLKVQKGLKIVTKQKYH